MAHLTSPLLAVDPNLIDADGLKFAFGSYNDGIFQLPLSNISTVTAAPPGKHLAGANSEPSEGGEFTYKPRDSEYYFQFFSKGLRLQTTLTSVLSSHRSIELMPPFVQTKIPRPPPGKEYKVLVGRSKSVSGPFLDKNGSDLTKAANPPAGTLFLGSHDNIYAPGGQSVYMDPVSGRDIMVYHYVPNDKYGGPSYLGIKYLNFTSGWPVVVDE